MKGTHFISCKKNKDAMTIPRPPDNNKVIWKEMPNPLGTSGAIGIMMHTASGKIFMTANFAGLYGSIDTTYFSVDTEATWLRVTDSFLTIAVAGPEQDPPTGKHGWAITIMFMVTLISRI